MKTPSFGTPVDDILTIPDSETIRIPSGAQIGLDGPLKAQPSRTIRRVPETVLDDQAGLAIRTELKAIDLHIVQHPAIAEPVAIRISDHLRAFREQNLLFGSCLRDARLEGVDELDRRQPQPAHFARHVLTHVREISVLRSDQVRPVARGHIGLPLGFAPDC